MPYTRPNISKSGFTVSGRRKSWSKRLDYQRSMPIIVNKINSLNRLMGGADEEPIVEETSATSSEFVQEVSNPSSSSLVPSPPPSSPVETFLEESRQLAENSQNEQLPPASGPCCCCVSQTLGSVGDKKVDEIIEYVQQNLEEASKVLATLGENFEHDLKVEPHVQLECRKTVSTSRRRKRRGYN